MLPGDYIAMRLTNEVCTTVSGLSEGIFWDFKNACVSKELLAHYGFDESIIAKIVPTFGVQGAVSSHAAQLLGLTAGTPVTYRAGDQPNNALSLNVFNPGEIALTAGTSGVVYGINGSVNYDPLSRVNTFAHVNHKKGTDPAGRVALHQRNGHSQFMDKTQHRSRRYFLFEHEPAGIASRHRLRRSEYRAIRQRCRTYPAK